jgi:two-component system OmpR family sensor kinase
MFRSIRWRLVLSYVLLTLLTVSLVGVLALSLVRRSVGQQETEHLTANAEAVARQALPLLRPVVRQRELQELAQTSSFLGNARVRILDAKRRVLADAWPSAEGDEFVWILVPFEGRVAAAGESFPPFIVALPSGQQRTLFFSHEGRIFPLGQLPPETAFTHVRRWEGMWGSRFRFYTLQDGEALESEALLKLSADGLKAPRSQRVIAVPIGEGGNPLGHVEISGGPDFGTGALRTTRRAFLLAAGGATLMATVVGLLVSRRVSAPLRGLAQVAGQMSSGDLSARAPVRGKDEIGQLAAQFNHMAERLEVSFADLAAERDALRRFIADASHELRTPITALKNFNDLLQGAAADDAAARAEFLAESQVQLDRLEWITRNLLDLSRLDAGLAALDVAGHDAGELIEAVAGAFKAIARAKGIALSIRPPESPLELHCDRARIELALSNLLDNAFKFTPPGGEVEIGAQRDAPGVRLWVRDTGPGIDPADQPHIFERFYRGRNNCTAGSGLGLAIVQSVVRAHGGQVAVESEPGAGSLFAIALPQG